MSALIITALFTYMLGYAMGWDRGMTSAIHGNDSTDTPQRKAWLRSSWSVHD